MQLEDFLDLLEDVKPAGNGYVGVCPAHDDREPSLGVTEGDNSILVNCHAGCATEAVLEAMGLTYRDLFSDTIDYAEPEAVYDYTDEGGNVLFQAIRYPGKKFRQRHRDESGELVWNLDGVRRVPYRLPEVLEAVRAGSPVAIVEGEKDVESLRALGKVATCNPMGAGKWREEYAQFFQGAKVILIADRDEPGRAHAEVVRTSLQGVAESILLVQAKKGKDVTDHLAAGLELQDLVPVRQRVRRGILTARELAEGAREDLELTAHDIPGYVLADAVPVVWRQGRMYAVGAYTGDGKTRYALQGARRLCEAGVRVGYGSLEMPERDLRNGFLVHRGIPFYLLEEPWRIKYDPAMAALYEEGVAELEAWNLDIVFDSGLTADKLVELAQDREWDVVIVDHVHRFGWGQERRSLEAQVQKLTNMALEQNVMVLLLCQLREPRMSGKDIEMYPMPTLQSFRETGVIGQDSSMALVLWRQRDSSGMRYTGSTQVVIVKNRHTTGANDSAGRIFMPHFDTQIQMLLPTPRGVV